jgi:lipid-A-disaccharide synthase-like uncharacterized protein
MLETISGIIASGALSIGYLLTSLFPFLPESLATKPEQLMLIIGFAGQGLFAMRFIIQWLKSEGEGRSVIPLAFWYFSIGGGLVLFLYALWRQDPVIICGQGAWTIYLSSQPVSYFQRTAR